MMYRKVLLSTMHDTVVISIQYVERDILVISIFEAVYMHLLLAVSSSMPLFLTQT